MEILEKLGNNPLIVSLITLFFTTIIGALGYILKKVISNKREIVKNTNQQSNIIQNFNAGITYNEARQIAEEVVEDKLSKMKKQ